MKKRQWVSFIMIVVVIMMGFTACSNKEEKIVESPSLKNNQSEYKYQTTFHDIDIESMNITVVSSPYISNEKVYMLATQWVENEKKDGSRRSQCIVQCELDGSNLQIIELEIKEGEEIIAFTINDKKQICFLLSKMGEEKSYYYLYTANKKGTVIKKIQLKTEGISESNSVMIESDSVIFSGKNIYFLLYGKIYTFNQKGKVSNVYELDSGYTGYVCKDLDKNFYIYGEYGLEKFNPETKEKEQILSYGEYGIHNISSLYFKEDRIYLKDEHYLYAINLKSKKLDIKFNWLNNDINGESIIACFPVEKDILFSVSFFYDERKQKDIAELIMIYKVNASEVKEKTILNFSCIHLDSYVKSTIIEFNKTNENYRVEIRDYEDYEDPEKQMNLDIISGNMPDIIDVSGSISKKNLINKGVLLDLYPFMEKDKEVTKENFLPSVLETLEVDHKLYYMPSAFYIQALIAPKNKVGDIESWSIEDMMELYKSMPKHMTFIRNISRQWFVKYIISHQIDDYVHWSTGKVNFASDEFIKLLEFSKYFPDESDTKSFSQPESVQDLVQKGTLMMDFLQFPIFSIKEISYYTKLYAKQGGYTILSYPSKDKNNKICMFFDNAALAITAQCKDKEGAWEFVRQFLTYDYQKMLTKQKGIPTRRDTLDKILEYAQATKSYIDEDGTRVSRVAGDWDGIPLGPLSSKEVEQIRSIVDRVGICSTADTTRDDISKIVSEEAEAFFVEDKTAKEVADIIQNRVRIYVSENL